MNTNAVSEALLADCRRADAINRENLLRILADNADTAFGQEHGFQQIHSVEEFRAAVPLRSYVELEPYIMRMREGSARELTAYPLLSFALTSGTESEPKFIPATVTAQTVYGNGFEDYQDSVVRASGGRRLYINTFRSDLSRPMEPLLLYSEIYYRHLCDMGLMDMAEYVGGAELMFFRKPGTPLFGKAWAALLEENITVIESIFLYDQLQFFNYLENNWRVIVKAIRSREFPEGLDLAEPIREALLALPVDEDRLRRVEVCCEAGFADIAHRLWPRLRLISGVSNRAYAAEDAALRRYVGDVPQFYFCYGSSECYFGVPVCENEYDYLLHPRHAFFEFIPFGKEEVLLPRELRVGDLYEIVFTSFAGLYRYRIGDVLRVKGFVGESPVLEYAFRKNLAINMAGEKMGTTQIEAAVQRLGPVGGGIEMYCLGASIERMPGRYLAVLAVDAPETVDEERLSREMDEALQASNSDYRDLRALGSVEQAKAFVLDRDSYRAFLRDNHLVGGHNKPKHIAPDGLEEKRIVVWKNRK